MEKTPVVADEGANRWWVAGWFGFGRKGRRTERTKSDDWEPIDPGFEFSSDAVAPVYRKMARWDCTPSLRKVTVWD